MIKHNVFIDEVHVRYLILSERRAHVRSNSCLFYIIYTALANKWP